MEIHWLRYFYEVARHQSVTQASRAMHVSQPAVSKMIKQIEERLKHPLFHRVGRRMKLTPEGERLYRHSIVLFKKWDEILQLEKTRPELVETTMKVGVSDNLALYVFPEVLRAFQERYPKVSWSIFTGSSKEIKQKLFSGEVDYGIFYTELGLGDRAYLHELSLGKTEFVAVTASNSRHSKTLAELRKTASTYVGVRQADYAHTVPEQWVVNKLKLRLDGKKIEANSKEVQKRLVLAGLGFGVFPRLMVQEEISAKKLALIKGSESQLEVRFVMRNDESLTEPAQWFIKIMSRALKSLSGR